MVFNEEAEVALVDFVELDMISWILWEVPESIPQI
jgi:hypothetical protein